MSEKSSYSKPSILRNPALIKTFLSKNRIYNGIINRLLDYRLGIETRVVLDKRDFGLDPTKLTSSNRYEGTAYFTLKTVFSSQYYPIKNKSLLDIGSGKGRVLYYSLSQGAQRVMGIELSPRLNEFCHENKKTFISKNRHLLETPEIFEGSFQDYTGPLNFDYIFLSNPFAEDLFKVFVDWLIERVQRTSKIIYYSPQHGHLLLKKGAVLEREIRTPFTREVTEIYSFKG